MAEKLRIGSQKGFLLELRLDEEHADGLGLIWGSGTLLVNGVSVMAGPEDGPVEWTWVDLLEWLAKNWSYLLCEQSFPFYAKASEISTLMRDLEKRWENMPEERVEDEEEEAFRFLNRHDLASAFKGIYLPAVFFMRQGKLFEVSLTEKRWTERLPAEQAIADLQQIGDRLAELASREGEGRGPVAARQWHLREHHLQEKALPLLTGFSSAVLASLNADNAADFWEQNPVAPLEESELVAAARMTGGVLLPEEQLTILGLIRGLGKSTTDKLDALSDALSRDFREIGKPYDQGYWAAIWLRRRLGLDERDAVKPAALLEGWGVHVERFEMPDSNLDALACWGRHHGPAILVNKSMESTPAHVHGENSTLAHEICHLLLDRNGALPVAEVLNGNTPERLEKRARAFAAEFLLPRSAAAEVVRREEKLKAAVEKLLATYSVSNELICWQIINSEIYTTLDDSEQNWLQNQVGRAPGVGER